MQPTRCLWLTLVLLMRGSVGEMESIDSPPPPPSIGTQSFLKTHLDDGTGKSGFSWRGESPPLPGNERKNDPDNNKGRLFPMDDETFLPSPGKRSAMEAEEAAVEGLGVNRRAFSPWGGKKRSFNPWGGKRRFRGGVKERKVDPAFDKRPGFQPWGGKKRSDKKAFNPWGGKRGSSPGHWSLHDPSKTSKEERELLRNH